MKPNRIGTLGVFRPVLVLLSLVSAGVGGEIEVRAPSSNVFPGDQPARIAVTTEESFEGRLTWRLAAGAATIQRGEVAVRTSGEAEQLVEFPVTFPPVKPGITLETTLSTSLVPADAGTPIAGNVQTNWVFHADPFAAHHGWLDKASLHVFDPEDSVTSLLEDHDIEFERLSNLDALTEISNGLLVVGEGISLEDYPGLMSLVVEQVQKTPLKVLILPLREGWFFLPGADRSDFKAPASLQFSNAEIVSILDKRLDPLLCWGSGVPARSGLRIEPDYQSTVCKVVEDVNAWPWMHADYSRGEFVVTMIPVVETWETSPTPRYWFVRVLEWLNK